MPGYIDVTRPPPESLSRESVIESIAARLDSRNVLGCPIYGMKKIAENVWTEDCIWKSILIEHSNKIYKIEGYQFQKGLSELFRDPAEYEMIGNFVLTNLHDEVVQIETLQQDLSTSKTLWESTFVIEKRSRKRDLEVIMKVLSNLRELSNDLTGYIQDIEGDIK